MNHLHISDELTDEELDDLREKEADLTWDEPSDDQKMRAWAITERMFAGDWSVFGLATLVALVIAGVGFFTLDAQAQDTTLSHNVGGHEYTWPVIGTPAYSASCEIVQAWEDGSSIAWCAEDGATYVFDADGDVTTGKQPGWYVANTTR